MLRSLRKFRDDQHGAVTVDWVVLTAAIIGFSIAVLLIFADATMSQSNSVGNRISELEVPKL